MIAGVLLFMVGLLPFIPIIYAVIIAISIYAGIKIFVGRRKKMLDKKIGEGFCLECGEKLWGKNALIVILQKNNLMIIRINSSLTLYQIQTKLIDGLTGRLYFHN